MEYIRIELRDPGLNCVWTCLNCGNTHREPNRNVVTNYCYNCVLALKAIPLIKDELVKLNLKVEEYRAGCKGFIYEEMDQMIYSWKCKGLL